jgi:hypothetical protein
VAAFADQNPGLCHARLPVVHQARHLQVFDGAVDVCIIEHDRGGLTSEFETHPLELFAAQRRDAPAGRR